MFAVKPCKLNIVFRNAKLGFGKCRADVEHKYLRLTVTRLNNNSDKSLFGSLGKLFLRGSFVVDVYVCAVGGDLNISTVFKTFELAEIVAVKNNFLSVYGYLNICFAVDEVLVIGKGDFTDFSRFFTERSAVDESRCLHLDVFYPVKAHGHTFFVNRP